MRHLKLAETLLEAARVVWEASAYPWSVRLKEIFRVWVPWIRRRFQRQSFPDGAGKGLRVFFLFGRSRFRQRRGPQRCQHQHERVRRKEVAPFGV